MFRGIDPEGLNSLAGSVELQTSEARHRSRAALEVLRSNGRNTDIASISSVIGRVERWAIDTANTLRWRADTIRDGQRAGLSLPAIARAAFAAEAIFSLETIDVAFRNWVAKIQASKQRIDDAVTDITAWLEQGWTDWDVTNDDLHNIWSTLDNLSSGELDGVIARLSPVQLERWIEEMGNGINGFSRDEKQEVFTMLASISSGDALGKVHDAILIAGGSEEAIDLGMAIRSASADGVIVDFVTYVVSNSLAKHTYAGVAPVLAADSIEDPAAINAALRAIVSSDNTLEFFVVDSLVATQAADDNAPNPLRSLVTMMSRATDKQLKATAWATLATIATDTDAQLRKLLRDRHHIIDTSTTDLIGNTDHDNAARDLIRTAELGLLNEATRLLVSDANEIVAQLATNLDTEGLLTSAYLHGLIDHEQIDDLAQIFESLRGGDEVDVVRFSEHGPDSNYAYPHAQNLAFVAATFTNALERYADDAKQDIDVIAGLASLASLTVGYAYSAVNLIMNVAGAGADFGVSSLHGANTQRKIDDQFAALARDVEIAFQPSTESETAPPSLGIAYWRWLDRYRAIYLPG